MQNLAFVYSAIETPWPGMGRFLDEDTGSIANALERGEIIVNQQLGVSIRAVLASDTPYPEPLLAPINTLTQMALTAAWRERGINPSALICRCGGEFATAHVSGAMNFEDALEYSCKIARLIGGGTGQGRLIVVDLSCDEATSLITDCPARYEVTAEANEFATVVGCTVNDVKTIEAFFENLHIRTSRTFLSFAPHTWLVDSWKDKLVCPFGSPQNRAKLPIHSATARGLLPSMLDWPSHFWRVVRYDLSIRSAIQSALENGINSFLEVGGQSTLRAFIESEAKKKGIAIASYSTMERNRSVRRTMDETFLALSQARFAT